MAGQPDNQVMLEPNALKSSQQPMAKIKGRKEGSYRYFECSMMGARSEERGVSSAR
jgi:hypothetical protein